MTGQEIYLKILESNLINFIIMISILTWIFKKFNLGKIIDNITYDIKNNVTSSAEAVKNALDEYKKTKKDSKNIDTKKEEILNDAKNIIQKLNEKTVGEISKKEEELDKNAEKLKNTALDKKIQKTTDEIKEAVYQLSIDTIHSILNDDIQKKIISNSLDELDKIEVSL